MNFFAGGTSGVARLLLVDWELVSAIGSWRGVTVLTDSEGKEDSMVEAADVDVSGGTRVGEVAMNLADSQLAGSLVGNCLSSGTILDVAIAAVLAVEWEQKEKEKT